MEGPGEKQFNIKRSRNKNAPSQDVIFRKTHAISPGGIFATGGVSGGQLRYIEDPKGRESAVVVKQYDDLYPETKHMLKHNADIYNQMKESGMKVPRTFRVDFEKAAIIVSDLNQGGRVALAFGTPSHLVAEHSITQIPRFETLAKNIFAEALKGSEKGYTIPTDAYFILVPVTGEAEADYVIGDFDNVYHLSIRAFLSKRIKGAILADENINRAEKFLLWFCGTWLTPETSGVYVEKVWEIADQARGEAAQRGLLRKAPKRQDYV